MELKASKQNDVRTETVFGRVRKPNLTTDDQWIHESKLVHSPNAVVTTTRKKHTRMG